MRRPGAGLCLFLLTTGPARVHSRAAIEGRQQQQQLLCSLAASQSRRYMRSAAMPAPSASSGVALGSSSSSSTNSAAAFAAMPRTYANALSLLGQLPTNREVTSLFEVAAPAPAGADAAADLNALAMPEVRAWLARAGYADPARDFSGLRCVHVAGTKGKGSVCAFVTAILVQEAAREAGEAGEAIDTKETSRIGRVGTYLSPHVVSVRERIWLDGRPISRGLFARYVFEVWERLSEAAVRLGAAARQPGSPPSDAAVDPYGPATKPFYFRFLTLVALHAFASEGVRSAVVECGIGGEYDVTNVLPPSALTAAAVTRLGIDHVAMLGRRLDQIAWHKAGIFKPGVAAFTLQPGGEQDALQMLRARAREKGAAALYELPPAWVDRWDGVPGAALPGSFQKHNMALAAALARHHLQQLRGERPAAGSGPDSLDPASMPPRFRTAMAAATLRARCEAVRDPEAAAADWLVDGAHTADSLAEVARFFAASAAASPDVCRILLFSVRDRSPADLARALLTAAGGPPGGFFDHALLVFPPPHNDPATREAALQAVAAASPGTAASAWDDVPAAVARIRTLAGSSSSPSPSVRCRVLATGSFVLAREVLQELRADSDE